MDAAADNGDVLAAVLARLEPRDLAAPRAVSRAWRAACDAALPRAFARHWGLAAVRCAPGAPRRPSFMHIATLASFAHTHRVARGDTFASVAVRHGVRGGVAAVKIANNVISDHSLHSRAELLVPVAARGALAGRAVEVRHCAAACRDVAVVLPEQQEEQDSDTGREGEVAAAAAQEDDEEEAREEARDAAAARRRLAEVREAARRAEETREKIAGLLVRSMRCDEATAVSEQRAQGQWRGVGTPRGGGGQVRAKAAAASSAMAMRYNKHPISNLSQSFEFEPNATYSTKTALLLRRGRRRRQGGALGGGRRRALGGRHARAARAPRAAAALHRGGRRRRRARGLRGSELNAVGRWPLPPPQRRLLVGR